MTIMNEHSPILAQDANELAVRSLTELRLITRDMLAQTRRSVDIVSRDLDPRLYDDDGCLDALRKIAIGHRKARIRILAQDLDTPVRRDHRLIELARRLSSFMEIRRLSDDYKDYNEAYLIADRTGVVHRSQADRFEAWASYHQPLRARELLKTFEDAWEHAIVDPNMRRLHL